MLDNKEFNNEVLLQKIAKKINISEVTFINVDQGNFFIRWFSPLIEVDICGHGTIAGFEILVFTGICEPDQWRTCLLYTSPSPRDGLLSRMPSSA